MMMDQTCLKEYLEKYVKRFADLHAALLKEDPKLGLTALVMSQDIISAEQVTEEHHQYAEVKEVRAPAQLPPSQKLRRIALPGVLVAVEAHEASDEEYGQRDVRVDAEQELVQVCSGSHFALPNQTPALRRLAWHESNRREFGGACILAIRRREGRRLRPVFIE